MPSLDTITDALTAAQRRGLLPTTMGTGELRELGEQVLARSVFTARGSNAVFVDALKRVVDEIAGGNMDDATARVTLLEALRATGYTPEGGFPDAPEGSVPPALKGTLQDLSSARRLRLIVETQRQLMVGAGWQMRGSTAERLKQFPAWELVRVGSRMVPRDWQSRWIIAGGTLVDGGRMIALKGDPVWGELGSYGNFEDALGVDHPPFAFNSGMGWREIDRGEVRTLGIRGPNGETPEEYHGGEERPRTLAGPLPQIAVGKMDPEIRKEFETRAGAVTVLGTAAPRSRADELRARMAERLRSSVETRKAEYAGRGA